MWFFAEYGLIISIISAVLIVIGLMISFFCIEDEIRVVGLIIFGVSLLISSMTFTLYMCHHNFETKIAPEVREKGQAILYEEILEQEQLDQERFEEKLKISLDLNESLKHFKDGSEEYQIIDIFLEYTNNQKSEAIATITIKARPTNNINKISILSTK